MFGRNPESSGAVGEGEGGGEDIPEWGCTGAPGTIIASIGSETINIDSL